MKYMETENILLKSATFAKIKINNQYPVSLIFLFEDNIRPSKPSFKKENSNPPSIYIHLY